MTVYTFDCDNHVYWYSIVPGVGVRLLTIEETRLALEARKLGQLRKVRLEWQGRGRFVVEAA